METRKYSIEEAVEHLHNGGLIKYDVKNPALFNSIIRLAGSDYDYSFEKNKCYSFGGYGLVKYSEHSNGIPLSSISETPVHDQPKSASEAASVEQLFENEAEVRYPVKRHSNSEDSPYVGIQKTFLHGCNFGYNAAQSQPNQLLNEAVELLTECKLQIEHMQRQFRKTGSSNAVISRLDRFLSKIKSV